MSSSFSYYTLIYVKEDKGSDEIKAKVERNLLKDVISVKKYYTSC